jgi:hypothetical protein
LTLFLALKEVVVADVKADDGCRDANDQGLDAVGALSRRGCP